MLEQLILDKPTSQNITKVNKVCKGPNCCRCVMTLRNESLDVNRNHLNVSSGQFGDCSNKDAFFHFSLLFTLLLLPSLPVRSRNFPFKNMFDVITTDHVSPTIDQCYR